MKKADWEKFRDIEQKIDDGEEVTEKDVIWLIRIINSNL